MPDANDAAAVPMVAWSSQKGPERGVLAPTANRSSTPTNVVYPVVEPGYTPPPVEISSVPILGGPANTVTSTAVASRTIVSGTSLAEEGGEGDALLEGASKVSIHFLLTVHSVANLSGLSAAMFFVHHGLG